MLSLFVVKEELDLPREAAGRIWQHQFRGQASRMHHHAELELNLVTAGRATYLLNDRKYQLRQDDVIWLFPSQDHVLLDQSSDFGMWIAVWKPQTIRDWSTPESRQTLREENPHGDFHRRFPANRARRIAALCLEIAAADLEHQNAGLPYLLLVAWAEFNATEILASGEDVHPCVERAARLLRDGEEMSLEVLARCVGLSPSRLSRLFKAQTGVAICEFRNRQRIERFFHFYNSGYNTGRSRTLSEAALEAGFGSYAQFHRVFKRTIGQSPLHFARGRNVS